MAILENIHKPMGPTPPVVGYESEALTFKDYALKLMSDLINAAALANAQTAGRAVVTEEDMKQAMNEMQATFNAALEATSPDEFVATLKKAIERHKTPGK